MKRHSDLTYEDVVARAVGCGPTTWEESFWVCASMASYLLVVMGLGWVVLSIATGG